MTAQELKERCNSRNFDQIIVVVKDIFRRMANMQKIQKVNPGSVSICTNNECLLKDGEGNTIEYSQKQASYYYSNTEICFVEPVCGDTIYSRFLEKCGEGICCIRERMSEDTFARMKDRFGGKGYQPCQCADNAVWFDLMDDLGIVYEMVSGEPESVPCCRMNDRIAQINISTSNVQQTIEFITDLFEIGPWEVGRQCNAVAHDTAFTVNGELKDQEFAFKLAILVCGNIEWEVIEPEVGELVYTDFVNRRRIGFHHILQEIPAQKWTERLDTYASDGISINCKGGLGPVSWCYMDTEKELGFYIELRTDAVMDKLPDGYVLYFYPED